MIPCKVSSLIRKVVHSIVLRDKDEDEDKNENGEAGVATGVRGDAIGPGTLTAWSARHANNR